VALFPSKSQDDKDEKIKEVEMSNSPQSRRSSEKEDSPSSEAPISNLLLYIYLSVPALCQTLSGYMGNKSLEFVDMTTKTICKSMKPVPILLLGVFMGNF
jgi:hypothetical protein